MASADPTDVNARRQDKEDDPSEERMFSVIAVLVGLSGIGAAYYAYVVKPATGSKISEKFAGSYRVLLNKYYVDELYNVLFVQSIKNLSSVVLWKVIDEGAIDGTANGLADGAQAIGGAARRLQSGLIRNYAAWIVIGAVGVVMFMTLVWAR